MHIILFKLTFVFISSVFFVSPFVTSNLPAYFPWFYYFFYIFLEPCPVIFQWLCCPKWSLCSGICVFLLGPCLPFIFFAVHSFISFLVSLRKSLWFHLSFSCLCGLGMEKQESWTYFQAARDINDFLKTALKTFTSEIEHFFNWLLFSLPDLICLFFFFFSTQLIVFLQVKFLFMPLNSCLWSSRIELSFFTE